MANRPGWAIIGQRSRTIFLQASGFWWLPPAPRPPSQPFCCVPANNRNSQHIILTTKKVFCGRLCRTCSRCSTRCAKPTLERKEQGRRQPTWGAGAWTSKKCAIRVGGPGHRSVRISQNGPASHVGKTGRLATGGLVFAPLRLPPLATPKDFQLPGRFTPTETPFSPIRRSWRSGRCISTIYSGSRRAFFAIAFTGQCLLDAEFLPWLQVERVSFDIRDDLLHNLPLEAAERVLHRLAFLEPHLSQRAPPYRADSFDGIIRPLPASARPRLGPASPSAPCRA